jgi:hypothetical protein
VKVGSCSGHEACGEGAGWGHGGGGDGDGGQGGGGHCGSAFDLQSSMNLVQCWQPMQAPRSRLKSRAPFAAPFNERAPIAFPRETQPDPPSQNMTHYPYRQILRHTLTNRRTELERLGDGVGELVSEPEKRKQAKAARELRFLGGLGLVIRCSDEGLRNESRLFNFLICNQR